MLEQIISDFEFLDDWEDRYRYIIELGRALPPLPDPERTAENKVRGCASQVWLSTRIERENGETRFHFVGDSDALIVRGLVALVIAMFDGKTAREILATDAVALFEKLGLREHLTPQRSNGFRSMVERIRADARASIAAVA